MSGPSRGCLVKAPLFWPLSYGRGNGVRCLATNTNFFTHIVWVADATAMLTFFVNTWWFLVIHLKNVHSYFAFAARGTNPLIFWFGVGGVCPGILYTKHKLPLKFLLFLNQVHSFKLKKLICFFLLDTKAVLLPLISGSSSEMIHLLLMLVAAQMTYTLKWNRLVYSRLQTMKQVTMWKYVRGPRCIKHNYNVPSLEHYQSAILSVFILVFACGNEIRSWMKSFKRLFNCLW